MNHYDVLWIEDEEDYHESILYGLKIKRDELKFAVIPWYYPNYDKMLSTGCLELSSLHMSLVLVDNNLPGIDGDAIIAKIRSFPANNNIPIIFYSGGKNIEELQTLTSKYENIIYSQKDTLQSDLEDYLTALQ